MIHYNTEKWKPKNLLTCRLESIYWLLFVTSLELILNCLPKHHYVHITDEIFYSTACFWPPVFSKLSFSYSLYTERTSPVPLCQNSRRLCGSELLTLSGQWLELQYLFHRLFIKLRFHSTVYHLCSLSLWVSPAGTSCSPGHCPPVWWPHFPIKAIYLPVIWLMCLPVAA